jgi:NAD(P)-dependent dehydrogenase (short-subunit alcohol dehydrogenase family)
MTSGSTNPWKQRGFQGVAYDHDMALAVQPVGGSSRLLTLSAKRRFGSRFLPRRRFRPTRFGRPLNEPDSIPLKRWGEPEDIAHFGVVLASDEFSYIHGDLVRIDGGETLCRYSV